VFSIGSFDTLAYNSALFFALLLTINRLCIFVLEEVEKVLFKGLGMIMWGMVNW